MVRIVTPSLRYGIMGGHDVFLRAIVCHMSPIKDDWQNEFTGDEVNTFDGVVLRKYGDSHGSTCPVRKQGITYSQKIIDQGVGIACGDIYWEVRYSLDAEPSSIKTKKYR